MTRIAIDPNVRTRWNWTYTTLDSIDETVEVGQIVEVWEPESGIVGSANVTEIDVVKGLVYLAVDWPSLRYRG